MKRFILTLQLLIITSILILSNSCSRAPYAPTSSTTHSSTPVFSMSELEQPSATQPHHIALLLPLTGSYASYATAIRNGFFTAFYNQKNRAGHTPIITVYNTVDKNITDVVQTAIAQGADFIVGPLDKSDVVAIASLKTTTIPILALNTTSSNMPINNNALYEFGLSPTDEAQQAAIKASQDQRHNVIIIAPNNAWGQRAVTAFSNQWKTLGGSIVATQYYGDIASLSKNIQHVLQVDRAYQDEHKLKNLFHTNMRFIPDRRHDFDSIFLIATPEMGRQIQPLLQFYFAGDIPIYATSQIYAGAANPNRDTDLNGILFCDMPWILTPNQMQPPFLQTIQQRIQTLWPNTDTRYAKFYAMGVDAFDLAIQLNKMQQTQLGMPGATGTLYVTPQHDIYRYLVWAQFQNGVVKIM